MTSILGRVLYCRNISYLSRFSSQSSCFSTKIKSSTVSSSQIHKFALFKSGQRCFSSQSSLNSKPLQNEIFQPRLRYLSTETNKSTLGSSFLDDKETPEEYAKRQSEEREKRWKKMKLGFVALGCAFVICGSTIVYELSRPNVDEDGNVVEDEFSHLPFFEQRFKRLIKEMNLFRKYVQEPSREKLLPDTLKYPYIQPPYTVILEVKDFMIFSDWTYQTGWRFKKRPGLDQFLEAIAPPQFETVVFTADHGMTVFPLIDALDPNGYIMYRLVRDATRFVNGCQVKDLDYLNRDLSKVIVIDFNAENLQFHPDNLLKIPRWTGNDDDTTLYDLAAFLKTIHASNVEDVRDVLRYYRQFEDPMKAFRENQRKLLEQMAEQESKTQQQQQPHSKISTTTWKPSFLKNII